MLLNSTVYLAPPTAPRPRVHVWVRAPQIDRAGAAPVLARTWPSEDRSLPSRRGSRNAGRL